MKLILATALCLVTATALLADGAPTDGMAQVAEARRKINLLRPQMGDVSLKGGVATISLSPRFRYLDPEDTETVLSGIWHNPKGAARSA